MYIFICIFKLYICVNICIHICIYIVQTNTLYFSSTVYNLTAGFIILKAQLAKILCVQGGHYDLLRCVR